MGEYQALSEKNVKQTTSAIYSVHVVRFPYPFIYLNFEKGTPFGWSLPVQANVRSTTSPPPPLPLLQDAI